MKVPVDNAGQIGIVEAVHPMLLPNNAWDEGNNIRFCNNSIRKIPGSAEIDTTETTDTNYIIPIYRYTSGTKNNAVVYCGLEAVYYFNGSTHTDITRLDTGVADPYTGSASDIWTGVVAQSVLYLTNGVDAPQVWLSDELENLPWDSGNTWADESNLTKILRTYKNFMIALTFKEGSGGEWNNYRVWWSHPAEPFSAPVTWDAADETKLAGYVDLASTKGGIIDGLPLRDVFVIYKEDAVILMTYVGGASIFNFRTLTEDKGLLSTHAVKEFDGKHFVVGANDIYITDGNSITSVMDGKLCKDFFNTIDPSLASRTFVFKNQLHNEMWVCYPSTGTTNGCDKALIWNWVANTWSKRDLAAIQYMASGLGTEGSVAGETWNDDLQTWDEDLTPWNSAGDTLITTVNYGVTNTKILSFDTGYTNDSSSYTSYVSKTYLRLNDKDTISQIKAIYPRGTGEMNVYVGACMHQNDAFSWEGPYTIDPALDAQIRCRVTGRYHALKFEFSGDTEHTLEGFDIEYVPTGYGR